MRMESGTSTTTMSRWTSCNSLSGSALAHSRDDGARVRAEVDAREALGSAVRELNRSILIGRVDVGGVPRTVEVEVPARLDVLHDIGALEGDCCSLNRSRAKVGASARVFLALSACR
jgi:hypothetical protein